MPAKPARRRTPAEPGREGETINNYRTSLRSSILPALGNLRIREASVGRLDKFLREVAKDRPSAAKNAKVVLDRPYFDDLRNAREPVLDPVGEDEPELGGEHRANGRRWALAHRLAPGDRQAVVDGYRAGSTARELAERFSMRRRGWMSTG